MNKNHIHTTINVPVLVVDMKTLNNRQSRQCGNRKENMKKSERRETIESFINKIDAITLEIAEAGIDDPIATKILFCFNCKKARTLAKKLRGDVAYSQV